MRRGNRVIVINEENEYLDFVGTIVDIAKDGRLLVELDFTTWVVPFHPQELELF